MTEFIEVEVDEDEVMRGFDLQEQWAKHMLRDFIDDLADKGIELLRMHAPKPGPDHPYSQGELQGRIDRTGVIWQPARGGTYVAIVGVKAGNTMHPLYADQGTGVYSYTRDYIKSRSGSLMTFYGTRVGHFVSKWEVAGQRPQRFLYETWRDMAIFAEWRLMEAAAFKDI